MKAIITKFHGPTDFKGSRIIASDMDGNRATVPYDHSLDSERNHHFAAKALCAKMGWEGQLEWGAIKGGYAFVFVG